MNHLAGAAKSGGRSSGPEGILRVDEVVCDVGQVANRITNSTVEKATGDNNWCIMMGDDSQELPSMVRHIPEIYSGNSYLYYASLRLAYDGTLVGFSSTTSDSITVTEPPYSLSDFDTYFTISDDEPLIPPDYAQPGIEIAARTHAWAADDVNDFIIYDFWVKNTSGSTVEPLWVGFHADVDVSTAEGGSGSGAFNRDDLVGYVRDDDEREYISYMYDADNPDVGGDDTGGNKDPKESTGYTGTRLLYCPENMNGDPEGTQTGHSWWDWNSDPDTPVAWYNRITEGVWLNTPPSAHDFRYLQSMGPFSLAVGDSINVVFAFGVGEGLTGMRHIMNNAKRFYDSGYTVFDFPPQTPAGLWLQEIDPNTVDLSWLPNTEEDLAGYNVYGAYNPQGPYQRINPSLVDTNYYRIDGLTPGQRYYFAVTAVDESANESERSAPVYHYAGAPSPPANLRAISGNRQVTLRWEAVEGAIGYNAYRSDETGGPYTQLNVGLIDSLSYLDDGLTNGEDYFYVATSVDASMIESDYSGEVRGVPHQFLTGRVLLVNGYELVDPYGNPLPLDYIERFYRRWGVYHYDYDIWSMSENDSLPSLGTLLEYSAVVWYAEEGDANYYLWYLIGANPNNSVKQYLDAGGNFLLTGYMCLPAMYNSNPPRPGDFDYDYLGIDSTEAWSDDYFTWAIKDPNVSGYPDSMKIDVAKDGSQERFVVYTPYLRYGSTVIYRNGLLVDGSEPPYGSYREPIGHLFDGGIFKSALINFDTYYMPADGIQMTFETILDQFSANYIDDPVPLEPVNLHTELLEGDALRLFWDPSDEEDINRFEVWRRENGQPDSILIAILPPYDSDFEDNTGEPGTTYFYRIKIVDDAGQFSFSLPVSETIGRPQPPTGLTAVSGNLWVDLTWNRSPEGDVVGYKIFRKKRRDPFQQIGYNGVEDTTYHDVVDTNRIIYSYALKAVDEMGLESDFSDSVPAFPNDGIRKGILLVNGVDWQTYGGQIIDFYEGYPMTGNFPFVFWDLFLVPPSGGYPDGYNPIYNGGLLPGIIGAFSTVIWVGNHYVGDEVHWLNAQDEIMDYLQQGGNLILAARYGASFIDEANPATAPLYKYCHLTEWSGSVSITQSNPLVSTTYASDIVDVGPGNGSSSASLAQMCHTDGHPAVTEIFAFDIGGEDWMGGIRVNYPDEGQFVFVSGRPYRLDLEAQRHNYTYILEKWFEEPLDVGDEGKGALPREFALYQNYPNPFNPATLIKFDLPKPTHVKLEIFNLLGQRVTKLVDEARNAGRYSFIWDGNNQSGEEVASGVFFYRIEAGDYTKVRKMTILR